MSTERPTAAVRGAVMLPVTVLLGVAAAVAIVQSVRLGTSTAPDWPFLVMGLLLLTLAVLQYRWVGEVSRAEQDRMQRNLRTATLQFRDAFDVEVGRAFLNLQVGPLTARDGASDQYSDRYDQWVDTAEHPRIVSAIYLIDAAGRRLRLRQWNAATHTFEATPWPAALDTWRPQLEQDLVDFEAGRPVDRRASWPIDDALLIAPMRNLVTPASGARPQSVSPVFGYTALQLDLRYIQEEVFPALAARHWQRDGAKIEEVAGRGVAQRQHVLRTERLDRRHLVEAGSHDRARRQNERVEVGHARIHGRDETAAHLVHVDVVGGGNRLAARDTRIDVGIDVLAAALQPVAMDGVGFGGREAAERVGFHHIVEQRNGLVRETHARFCERLQRGLKCGGDRLVELGEREALRNAETQTRERRGLNGARQIAGHHRIGVGRIVYDALAAAIVALVAMREGVESLRLSSAATRRRGAARR